MKYIRPTFFDDFTCIADKCPCTCCRGWAIEIDDDSIERYRKLGINTVDYDEQVFRHDNPEKKRCLNLDNNGLCRLITEYGEDILCDTCRLFPRHIEEFKGVREYSLSISCPEVAKMILSKMGPVKFIIDQDDLEDEEEYDEYEQEMFRKLAVLREKMLEILQVSDENLAGKCKKILEMASEFQENADGMETIKTDSPASLEEIYSIMEQWEYTSEEFPKLLEKARKVLFDENKINEPQTILFLNDDNLEMKWQQIVVYFIYTCFCGSAYDEYYYGMAQLAVGAAIHIKLLCEAHKLETGILQDTDIERYTYLYARELEHSIPNVLATEAWMEDHRIIKTRQIE